MNESVWKRKQVIGEGAEPVTQGVQVYLQPEIRNTDDVILIFTMAGQTGTDLRPLCAGEPR